MKRNYSDFSYKSYNHLDFNDDNIELVLDNYFNNTDYILYKKENENNTIYKFKYNNIFTPIFRNWDELIAIL